MSGCVCHRHFIEGCPMCHQRAGLALPTREQTEASIAAANASNAVDKLARLEGDLAELAKARELIADKHNAGDVMPAVVRHVDELAGEVARLLSECSKRNHTINALNETIGDRDAKILSSQREVSRLKAGLAEMRGRFIGPGLLNALVVHDIDVLLNKETTPA